MGRGRSGLNNPSADGKMPTGGVDMKTESRTIYDKLTGQSYDVADGNTVDLKETFRERLSDGSYGDWQTKTTGTVTIEENDTDGVIAYGLPAGDKTFMAFDATRNTIMTEGRIALRKTSTNNDARKNVADIVNNEMYVLTGDRQEGIFYRVMGSRNEIDYLKNGTIRPSTNHMTGKKEAGLSVWEVPKYAGGTIAKITGKVIGIGSDGEPLLDPKTVRFVEEYKDSAKKRKKAIQTFAKTYGWSENQVQKALLGDVNIKK